MRSGSVHDHMRSKFQCSAVETGVFCGYRNVLGYVVKGEPEQAGSPLNLLGPGIISLKLEI